MTRKPSLMNWVTISTFNEELFVDYVIENYDKDTAVAVLSQHIGAYQNYFTFQPLITEFEYGAHKISNKKDNVSGAELNSLWTNLSKEYRSNSIEYYNEDSSEWTYRWPMNLSTFCFCNVLFFNPFQPFQSS
jgi:oligoendopeptidase F